MDRIPFICSPADGHLAIVAVVAIETAVNTGVQIRVQVPAFNSLGCIPTSGIPGSRGSSISTFLSDHCTVFPSSRTALQPTDNAQGFQCSHVFSNAR